MEIFLAYFSSLKALAACLFSTLFLSFMALLALQQPVIYHSMVRLRSLVLN